MRIPMALLGLTLAAAPAPPAAAQALGTFSWQLEPYCNIVTLTVTADGPTFRLIGSDDQCGAGKVPASGVATPNPDGTVTLTFSLIASGGQAGHTTATLSPPGYSGPWRDDGGMGGTLHFGAATGAGAPRPIPEFQRRVTGRCPGGVFMQNIREDGGVECAAAPGAGVGSIGSAQIADGSIGAADVNPDQIQRRVTGTCLPGLFLTGIGAGGAAICSDGATLLGSAAFGQSALGVNTNGTGDTAVGVSALAANTAGSSNTAVGNRTLEANTVGASNTAVGAFAMLLNTDGVSNVAIGSSALTQNAGGNSNTAIGSIALNANTTGSHNIAIGPAALGMHANGNRNVAMGYRALFRITAGDNNIAIGPEAAQALTVGARNIVIGENAGSNLGTSDHNIVIGTSSGLPNESDTIRIGNGHLKTYISGIRGKTTGANDAVAVLIDTNGQLGTASSSRRSKEDIRDMGDASAGLFKLRPVTFRYTRSYADGSKPRDYGLIAEEVDEVYPDLVVRNQAGEVETVQYHKLVPMLLNELQGQRREIERLRGAIAALEARQGGRQ